jgi:hypothetical protein
MWLELSGVILFLLLLCRHTFVIGGRHGKQNLQTSDMLR